MFESVRLINYYNEIVVNASDQRIKNWPLMSSPLPTFLLITLYLLMVKYGPIFMENRKPFKLTKVMVVYNAFQTIFSAWMFYECHIGWFNHYNYLCQPVDQSINSFTLRMLNISWWFYVSKFMEFTDTLFFILRKKNDQISQLHVIHHAVVPPIAWIIMKFVPIGHYMFTGYVNTFVHMIMYAYYMFAAMGPHMQKYLWWKRYLTTLQIVNHRLPKTQFVLVMFHNAQTLVTKCDVPKFYAVMMLSQAVMFYFMFSNFYKFKYVAKEPKIKMTDDEFQFSQKNDSNFDSDLKHRTNIGYND